MVDSKVGIPLTFVLALSVATPVAAAATFDIAKPLWPGSLRNLLDQKSSHAGDGASEGVGSRGSMPRMAQGCWVGYWRRC